MIVEKVFRGKKWINVFNPTYEEVRSLMSENRLDSDVAEEMRNPSLEPRIERYADYLYIILHFPAFKQSHSSSSLQEIDFIISNDFLITVHYDVNESIQKFSKIIDVESVTKKVEIENPTFFLFFKMLNVLYDASYSEVKNFLDELKVIESKIFKGNEKEMVYKISELSRDLLEFKQIISSHKDVLKTLAKEWRLVFGDKGRNQIERLIANYFRLKNEHHSLVDTMSELRETNNSLLSTKQNQIMMIFTILAFITLPLSLISSLFGMNTHSTPILGMENDFLIIIIGMVVVSGLLLLFFKLKKWL